MIIAGLAYVFDSTVQLPSPGFFIISQFTFILEITLPVWLLIKGIKIEFVEAEDKTSGKKDHITIRNDKGRLTKEEIDRMQAKHIKPRIFSVLFRIKNLSIIGGKNNLICSDKLNF